MATPLATAQPVARRWSEAHVLPFEFDGRWWRRGPSGEVVRYEPGPDRWVVATPGEAPFFMQRPRFTSLKAPAIWLYVLFGGFVLASLLSVWADAEQAILFDDLADGVFVSSQDVQDSDDFYSATGFFQVAAMIAIAPVFIWWTRRATCNVPALGARNPKYSPGWAVGWWFVPFALLWQPLRVLNQAWRASDPEVPATESDAWRSAPVNPILIIWWLAWAIIPTLWGGATSLREDPETELDEMGNIMRFILVMDGLMVMVALLAIAVVALLTARQERANQRFDVEAGGTTEPAEQATWPTPPIPAGRVGQGW